MLEESHIHGRADSVGCISVEDDFAAIVTLFQSSHNV